MSVQLEKAKILGFDSLTYDTQQVIFIKARMFGWTGKRPSVLGTHSAAAALDEALDYLLAQGVVFRKEQ